MNEPVYGSCLDLEEIILLTATPLPPNPQSEKAVQKDHSEEVEMEDESELYFNKRR